MYLYTKVHMPSYSYSGPSLTPVTRKANCRIRPAAILFYILQKYEDNTLTGIIAASMSEVHTTTLLEILTVNI
jgi:hypothetical protein